MLFRKKDCGLGGIAVLLCTLLYGCGARHTAPGGKEMPDRSMLPDHHILNLGEDQQADQWKDDAAGFPFVPRYMEWQLNGRQAKFVVLSLPDMADDQKVDELINRYQIAAPVLIGQWASRQTGILLDLRNNGNHTHKAEFLVQAGETSFPAVLVWDDATTERANRYIQWIETLPLVLHASRPLLNDSLLLQLPATGLPDRQLLQDPPAKRCFY
ncbi:hypothetical protein [Chitinophaga qingshengii]|uniref:Uncharacterized protein n=1 Tax=Chitinophaga qingshengii TaxID=1569794 RepID=A0ABR7TMZ2_9BACT|nr:hypothetical protein [Chitinophaga qingshengii]MBC9931850.1 hypothetical protein [Chitinophaga qingshengii]